MNLKLVEPRRELFKDEVRALGRELGLPERLVGRHPFPGPGLAIRVPGAITRDKLEILRKADTIYLDEIRKAGLYDTIWQAFVEIGRAAWRERVCWYVQIPGVAGSLKKKK